MSFTSGPLPKGYCCKLLHTVVDDSKEPFVWDEDWKEIALHLNPGGTFRLYYCPFCGITLPRSRRRIPWCTITEVERARLEELTADVTSIEQMKAKLGEPDWHLRSMWFPRFRAYYPRHKVDADLLIPKQHAFGIGATAFLRGANGRPIPAADGEGFSCRRCTCGVWATHLVHEEDDLFFRHERQESKADVGTWLSGVRYCWFCGGAADGGRPSVVGCAPNKQRHIYGSVDLIQTAEAALHEYGPIERDCSVLHYNNLSPAAVIVGYGLQGGLLNIEYSAKFVRSIESPSSN